MSKNGWVFLILLFAVPAFAQPEAKSESPLADPPFEFGFHVGNLLPNQIAGVTEIMGLGGARMAMRLSPRSYFEGGFIAGNGEGQQWRNIHADVRIDNPVENLLASVYLGADAIYYTGIGRGEKLVFGGHVGGAVQMPITDSTWFRTDMKFGFSPGTSLYFSLGIVWRLGDSGSQGG